MHSPDPDPRDPRSGEHGNGGPDSMREDVIRFVDDEACVAFKDEPDKYLRFFSAFLETNRVCEESAPNYIEERFSKVADSLEEKPRLLERWNDDIGPKLRTVTRHGEAKGILKGNRELWAVKFADIVKRRCKDEARDRFLRIFCRYQNGSITFEEFGDETKQLFRDDPMILEIFRSFATNPHGDHDYARWV
ncbi:uncharacterized protein LOC115690668 [Syzygium oleosum]|uniref:uncharacterized protein LOC115690668 n=1 Tax=Syzygium oleosum TaxID=219896 RepID=UPI0011D19E75|nr:uncharacterized protein LOC115690668 [Syzygium oleosum]